MIEFQENITILSPYNLVLFKKYLRKLPKKDLMAIKRVTRRVKRRRKPTQKGEKMSIWLFFQFIFSFWLDGLLVHFVCTVNDWIDPEHYFILDGLVAVLLFWRNTWNGNGLNIWGRMGLMIAASRNFVVFAMCSFERGNRKAHRVR